MILVSGFLNTKYKNLIIFSLKKKPPVDTCLRYWLDYYQICWRKKKLMYLHNFFYYSTYYINFPLAPVIHKYASINILNLIKYFLIENCPFSNYKRNIKSIIKKRVKGLGGWLLFECLKHQIVTRMRFPFDACVCSSCRITAISWLFINYKQTGLTMITRKNNNTELPGLTNTKDRHPFNVKFCRVLAMNSKDTSVFCSIFTAVVVVFV